MNASTGYSYRNPSGNPIQHKPPENKTEAYEEKKIRRNVRRINRLERRLYKLKASLVPKH